MDINKKVAGILGGMGPQATINLYKAIIDKSIKEYNVRDNSEFPEMLIRNHSPKTVLDNNSLCVLRDDILDQVEKLLSNDVDFFVIPCNTIHIFTDDIRQRFDTPFVSILESVVEEIKTTDIRDIAIVGSKTTIQNKLYENPLRENGYDNLYIPDEDKQNKLVDIIESIISKGANIEDANKLDIILDSLAAKGAKSVVLGCTELPLVKNMLRTKLKIFDSVDVLANAVCKNIFN